VLIRGESVQPGQSNLRISKRASHPKSESTTEENAGHLFVVTESDEAEEDDLIEDEDHVIFAI
jgi:hypothetical protein